MLKVNEIITVNEDNTLTFGNFEVVEKQKVADFEYKGDKLAVKTYKDVTVLKRDGNLIIETVPGSVIENFLEEEFKLSFDISGYKYTSVTLATKPEQEYKVYIDDKEIETVKSKLSGKLSISVDIENTKKSVRIERI